MAKMEETKKAVIEFLKETLNAKDVKVLGVTRIVDEWEAKAEVYEESSFIKALGLSTRVQDRNIYVVKLDSNLEVQSYQRKEE